MLPSQISGFAASFDNFNNATAYPSASSGFVGQTITLKASTDVAGATWFELASAAELTAAFGDSGTRWILFGVAPTGTGAADKSAVYEIGVDPAGGSSYAAVFSNVIAGPAQSGAFADRRPKSHLLPFMIGAGASVAVRGGTTAGADDTTAVAVFAAWGRPSRPESAPFASKTETLGYVSGAAGTVVNAGARAWGSWVSLGTTTFPWTAASIAVAANTGTLATENYWLELGYGDGTTCTTILAKTSLCAVTNETIQGFPDWQPLMSTVPAGATVYARMNSSASSPANNGLITVVAIGVG